MDNQKQKVLVGMSGGIDSSAVCMMLQEQGYEVMGVTMRMWDTPSKFKLYGQEDPDYVIEARELAETLSIHHITLDIRQEFRASVVQSFIDEYMAGRTPNPCVMCNREFKFKYLLELADRYGCQYVATGHYARVARQGDDYYIHKGVDASKDQSYFLWRLDNEVLSRTLFPLGTWHKSDVKQWVLERGYREKAQKPESMEICFVENDYRELLSEMVPQEMAALEGGAFVAPDGRRLGTHQGYPNYTVGQRKGLRIALGYPAFVTRIDPSENKVVLGQREDLLSDRFRLSDARFQSLLPGEAEQLEVKIRYRSPGLRCQLPQPCGAGASEVQLHDPASAVTPGQSAVFYVGDKVVGGGIIAAV